MIPVVIIRHPKERHNKCSLTPVRWRDGFQFYKSGDGFTLDANGYLLLSPDAPVLAPEDATLLDGHDSERDNPGGLRGLLLLDATWRLLPQLERCLTGEPIRRSLPTDIKTAYPRVSKETEDPANGLASIEALYMALKILGHDDPTLLDGYYWKEQFLAQFQ